MSHLREIFMKGFDSSRDVKLYPVDEIATLVDSFSPKELQEYASKSDENQIRLVLLHLIDSGKPHWSTTLHAFLRGIEQISCLEAIGRVLNLAQLIEFLDFASIHKDQAWKLFPIFITIPHPVFSQMLLDMPEKRKQQLQLLCTAEPLQHHLLMYSHELTDLFDTLFKKYLQLEESILVVDGVHLTSEDLGTIQGNIEELREEVNHIRSKIENALSLAWNAGNGDLIEMLSNYRERYERFLFNSLGHSSQYPGGASGLYQLLENRLAVVFDEKNDGAHFEALKDNEPAIEALGRLSLWYIEDYWKIGLLPEVVNPQELSLPAISKDDQLRLHYQTKVKQNLKLLGLKTVKDFKRNHLVSQSLLNDYIVAHKHKLTAKNNSRNSSH